MTFPLPFLLNRSTRLPSAIAALTLAFIAATASLAKADEKNPGKTSTSDWPEFRGPGGQGVVDGSIPKTWSNAKGKIWETPIVGKAWSSPVVAGDTIWMTTAAPTSEAKNASVSLRVVAVDRKSGKIVRDFELFHVEKPNPLHARNSLATPTPVADNGRIYISFGAHGIAAIDAESGKVLWKNEDYRLDYETGAASSPVVYKDKLIVPCDASDAQFVVALSTADGKEVWKTERPIAEKKSKTSRRAFATPLVFKHNGKDQVAIPGAFCVYSYEPNAGKELWRVQYNGFSNVPRPVYANDMLYVCTGFSPPELIAIRPDGEGDVTKSHVAWRYRKNIPNIPSPVVVGDRIFFVSDNGTATCLDARTGDLKWTERLQSTFSASLLAKEKTIYAFAEDGGTILFEAADEYREIGKNPLSIGRVGATPAVSSGALYIRSDSKLVKVGE